jgi:hypothetical protein
VTTDQEFVLADLLAIFPEGYTTEGNKVRSGGNYWTRENGLIWWCAYNEAEQMHECNTIKGWARALLDGIGPIDREYAVGFANQELEAIYEELGGEGVSLDECKRRILNRIREFFAIPLDGPDTENEHQPSGDDQDDD